MKSYAPLDHLIPVVHPWTYTDWQRLEKATAEAAGAGGWERVARASRLVLRSYSTSFFIVTRFLPPAKRAEVQVVYASVRYPDEIVDTFPCSAQEKHRLLDSWTGDYERSLSCGAFSEALALGCSPFVSAFAEVVNRRGIPPEHYRSFLHAMRLDIEPRRYATLEDLIDSYIYGSAIVVGYFLAYIYGPSRPEAFDRALASARNLGIALQLTNFLRDIGEDRRRGRVYLPSDMLLAQGLSDLDINDPGVARVLRQLSQTAESHYQLAERDLDAFAADSRVAIRACIDVYRRLNQRIGCSSQGVQHRETVPMIEKFAVLPGSKYWRLPFAYAGLL